MGHEAPANFKKLGGRNQWIRNLRHHLEHERGSWGSNLIPDGSCRLGGRP